MKRVLSIVLSLALCLSLLPLAVPVKAAGVEKLTYEIKDYKVTITGCDPYYYGAVVIPGSIEGYSVTAIADRAFEYTMVTDVDIPYGVTSIGAYAFSNCSYLEFMAIPDTVTSMGDRVFYSSGVISVNMPDNITYIPPYAFGLCTNLSDINIPQSVTSIGNGAYYNCTSAFQAILPNGLVSIGESAFRNCPRLSSISIPDSVTTIGEHAFEFCAKLPSVTLSENVTSIGLRAFAGCKKLSAITVAQNNPSYTSDEMGVLYNKDKTTLMQVPGAVSGAYTLPDSVTKIHEAAFDCCAGLTGITVSQNNTAFCSDAYGALLSKDQTYLIRVPGAISGGYTAPESVNKLDNWAFAYCTGIGQIKFTGSAPTILRDSVWYDDNIFDEITATIYYPEGDTTWNKHLSNTQGGRLTWVPYTPVPSCLTYEIIDGQVTITSCDTGFQGDLVIPGTIEGYPVTAIAVGAFAECSGLTGVVIPEGVTTIGGYAFENCGALTSITIPGSVTVIENRAFLWCDQLAEIHFAGSLPQIGDKTFAYVAATVWYPGEDASWTQEAMQNYGGCLQWLPEGTEAVVEEAPQCLSYEISGLEVTITDCDEAAAGELVIPNKIKGRPVVAIGEAAFQLCSDLTKITIPDSVTSIGDEAFIYCSKLTTINLPQGLTTIGDSAFESCESLTDIAIPQSVTAIGLRAFADCLVLQEITLPEGLSEIAFGLLWGCESLTSVTIPDSVTVIGQQAFCGCKSLPSVTLPEGITEIKYSTFMFCESLTDITIPDSVTTIARQAFSGCDSLTSVTIPDGVTSVEGYAFYICDRLTSVTVGSGVTSIGAAAFTNCPANLVILFTGDAPAFSEDAFSDATVTACYPAQNPTWTQEVRQNYGGTVTWRSDDIRLPALTLKYPNVSFEDEVVMKVYFDAQDIQDVVEMGLITYSQAVDQWTVDNAENRIAGYYWNEDAQLYYAETQGIPAAQMNQPIYFALYAQLTDGSYVYSRLESYSPSTYAYNLLEDETMGAMAVSLLNYGAAAQTYFETAGDGLMNDGLTEDQLALAESYRSDMVAPVTQVSAAQQGSFASNGGFVSRYPTVTFEGVFSIDYFVTPAATPVDGVTMYVWDQATVDSGAQLTAENAVDTVAMTNDGVWKASVGDIAACQLDDGVYVAFCYSDGTTDYCSGVLGYSIGAYCASQAEGDTALATLAKATAVYGYYAKQLFA